MSHSAFFSRRSFLLGAAALSMPLVSVSRALGAELGEDGLYRQPWFLQSFLDLREDLQEAMAAGKSFAVLWELKGCPYCKLLHTENFAKAEIRDYAKANFAILQLNLIGARLVRDFNGQAYAEKELALRHEVISTPTLQFFRPGAADGGREIGRTGYLKPVEFHQMLRFVHEKGYESAAFDDWMQRNPLKP